MSVSRRSSAEPDGGCPSTTQCDRAQPTATPLPPLPTTTHHPPLVSTRPTTHHSPTTHFVNYHHTLCHLATAFVRYSSSAHGGVATGAVLIFKCGALPLPFPP